MKRLSDNKLELLKTNFSNSLWYITKQNCVFRDLMLMARILELWNDEPTESFQSFFDRTKVLHPFSSVLKNTPHRALKNCEFYGIMKQQMNNSRAAYSSQNLTDVYFKIKNICNLDFFDTDKYQNIIDYQLENMKIIVNGKEINPILFTLKVLLTLGDATGMYRISNKEFKLFVCTSNEWAMFFEAVESIIRYRNDTEYKQTADSNYDIANDTRFNLVLDNLSYLSTNGSFIEIKQERIKDVRKIIADFELGETEESDCNDLSKTTNRTNENLQQILFGAPGTGKSHTINSDANITEQNSIRTTFHPDSDYSTFVGCYKPTKDEKSGEITYDFTPQAFTNAYVAAWKDLGNPFYLIIEEINRGNCAQIFGDIFQLLDRNEQGYSSYKTTPDQDLTNYIKTQFSETNIDDAEVKSGKKMQLPPNLHIWATMNTSDQSLFPIDSAFKRRWDWRYIPIDYTDQGHYINCDGVQYSWSDFLQKINEKVESVTQSEDKKLGYWFMGNGAEQKEITVDRFVSKVVFYLWNDVFKDFGKSGNTIFKDSFGKFHLFFDSSGKPKKDVVKAFLDALEVAERKDIFTDEELNEASNTSSSRFTLNGERLSLKDIAYRVVENYAGSNPTFTATQIKTVFIEACKNCGISHIVETNDEYQQRLSTQSSAERSQTSLKLNNGEVIHITTQWRAKKPEDNFFKFIEVCNKNNWGDIQKVEQ